MNDWLDYKGSESSRYYLSHGIFTSSLEQQQAIADERLRRAQERKKEFDHYITEYESFLPRLRDLENQIWTVTNNIGKSKYPNETDYNELRGLYNRCNSIYTSINQGFIIGSERWGRLNKSQPILDRVKEFHNLCNSYERAFTLGKRFYEEAQRRKEKLDAIHSTQTEHAKIGRDKK